MKERSKALLENEVLANHDIFQYDSASQFSPERLSRREQGVVAIDCAKAF